MPMSTTWVFLGLLAGREVALTIQVGGSGLAASGSSVGMRPRPLPDWWSAFYWPWPASCGPDANWTNPATLRHGKAWPRCCSIGG